MQVHISRLLPWLLCALLTPGCVTWRSAAPQTGAAGPRPPLPLHVDCVTEAVVGLRWQATTGNSTAAVYRVARDGVSLATTRNTYFPDSEVAAQTSYVYEVTALDAAGSVTARGSLEVRTPAAAPTASAPCCPSPLIASARWHWDSAFHEPNGSDLWPVTWGRDGAVYTFFGDGGGFGGDNDRGRASFGIARMSGPPPLSPATAVNIYGGYNSLHPAVLRGKASGIIAVGSSFYAIGGIYTAAELAARPGRASGMPKHVEIVYSKDNAYSWQAARWSFCADGRPASQLPVGGFCPIGFVNFGPGNVGAPDGQVYLLGFADSPTYWGDGGTVQAARTYLARVPARQVLNRAAYRYFAGLDAHGRPVWSAAVELMQPIFTDRNPARPGCRSVCNMAGAITEVVYNSALHRYLGTAQGDRIGQTSFYDSPEPWGPWTVVEYNNIDPASGAGGWGNLGSAGSTLGAHPVNAWTSADGRSLWVTYSSDGTAPADALFPPPGAPLDSFNLVRVDLNLRDPPPAP